MSCVGGESELEDPGRFLGLGRFFNGFASPERRALAHLFRSEHEICTCGVIVAEVFQGLRRDKGRARLTELFRDLTYLEPASIDSYFRAADLFASNILDHKVQK